MQESDVIENAPAWIPPDASRLGGPPRPPEQRRPLLWLMLEGSSSANITHELYLVNSSGEVLDLVVAGSGGFQTVDDDEVLTVGSPDEGRYRYVDVQPGSAVRVDQYDEQADSDFVLQASVRITSKTLGRVEFRDRARKGGFSEAVLLWDNGDLGKHVYMERLDAPT